MKMKIYLNLVLAVAVTLFVSSCLNIDDEEQKIQSKAEEMEVLNTYLDSLAAQGHDIDTTAMGVYYVVIDEGEGDFAQPGDTLVVGYSGYLMDNYMFDSSEYHYSDGKMEFELGNPPMIQGWDDGMQVMNEGAKVQFIIPSELAYGSEGNSAIPPNQTLIFVIKLFEINP